MGIKQKIVDLMEHLKFKRLSDGEIIEKIPEIVEKEPEKVAKVLGYVEEQEKVTEVLTDIAPDLSPHTVKKIVENLPEKEKVVAFKQSLAVRDKLTQADDKEELKHILKNKNINAYDELYKRINKGINDYELVDFITTFKENNNIGYDGEKIAQIISKQIALYIRKYKNPLKGHVQILLNVLETDEEKRKIPDVVIDEAQKIVTELGKNEADIEGRLSKLNKNIKQKEEKSGSSKKSKKDLQKLKEKNQALLDESEKIPYYIENLQQYKKEDLETMIEQIIEFDKERTEDVELV